jgi:hypothetical protein
MTNDVKKRVRILSVVGVAPAQILTLIRSKPSGEHVIARDVYNLKKQHRIEQLDGRTPMDTPIGDEIREGRVGEANQHGGRISPQVFFNAYFHIDLIIQS